MWYWLGITFTSPGPILWEGGGFVIRWYGVLIALGVVLGTLLCQKLAEQKGIKPDLIPDLALWLVIGAIPMARVYYVVFEWQNRFQYEPWTEVFAIWRGGIAIHGAIIGGTIAGYLFCRYHRLSFWQVGDIVMPALILGQAIGRWGNFFNSEAFGTPTDLPWKLYIPYDHRPSEYRNFEFFHPTFLYESLWNLMVFVILVTLWRRFPQMRPGTLVMVYLIGYSLGRVWIEGLRTDSLFFFGLRIAQLVSVAAIVLGAIGLWWLYGLKRPLPDIGISATTPERGQ
ncbi:MAG: prolipoprotein diacylglyceryl transferase [Pseudanabaenaceae cyanobacterium]